MRIRPIVLLLLLLSLSASLTLAVSAKPCRVSVIIRFKQRTDVSAITKVNGRISSIYHAFPAVAAEIPVGAIENLRRNPNIAYVELEQPRYVQGKMIFQGKPGKVQPEQVLPWGVDRIDADEIWRKNEGEGVNVAIIDTGIDVDHPDLEVNIEGVFSAIPPNPYTVDDHYGHGTHVAGTIAAVNNEIGVVGVGPQIDLWIIRASAGGILKLTDLLESYQFCIDSWFDSDPNNDIQVMSMSFGGGYSQAEDEILQIAWNTGIILVAAAGNEGGDVIYPAALPNVIAVSAVDIYDEITWWSNRGPEIDLAAPGSRITSTYLRGTYATWSGTSMATPHVSGAAALAIARRPKMTNEEIVELLFDRAEDLGNPGFDIYYGYGLVDAQAVGR